MTSKPHGMSNVCVLGSTGSIGTSTLDVLLRHKTQYVPFAFSAHRQEEILFAQCRTHRPAFAVLSEEAAATRLRASLQTENIATQVLAGPSALAELAAHPEVDIVVLGIVGAAGLQACHAAVAAGKRVLIANKEPLVMAGALICELARKSGAIILPVDSEHNAIFQCLPAEGQRRGVRRLILTASGGPLRNLPLDQFPKVTPDQACNHPNWRMGRKISVDSATMMNKGLEIMEAHWLFGVNVEKIEVVIHPQSVIHSLVEYADGSMLAHLSQPDMRVPIAHALAHPERINSGAAPLDLLRCGPLTFQAPEKDRFPCLDLAYQALREGGAAPVILNAANEEAVAAFLDERIGFLDIARLVDETLQDMSVDSPLTLPDILAVDAEARAVCLRHMQL